jgi:hypothetical protein
MAMKKSIGRTLAHIDVAANTSVRIQEDFFNTHKGLSPTISGCDDSRIRGEKRIYHHLSARRSKVRQARTGVGSGSITHKDYFVLQLRGDLS